MYTYQSVGAVGQQQHLTLTVWQGCKVPGVAALHILLAFPMCNDLLGSVLFCCICSVLFYLHVCSAGITGTADGVTGLVLPSIQDSPLVLTQDTNLQQALIQTVQAMIQSAPTAASSHAAALLQLLLQLRAGVLLSQSCGDHELQQVSAECVVLPGTTRPRAALHRSTQHLSCALKPCLVQLDSADHGS